VADDRAHAESSARSDGDGSRATERRRLILLFVLAASLKLAYALEYVSALPFFDAPIFDSVIYVHQAAAVRAGDFGDGTFVAFSPLYGYFLALFDEKSVVVVQLALGLVNLGLLYAVVRRLFDPLVAFVAGLLWVLYGLLLFYETKVMSETLGITLCLGAFALYLSPGFRRGRVLESLWCGVLLGFAVHARGNVLYSALFFGLVAAASWSAVGVGVRRRLVRTASFGLGFGLVLTLNGLWNLHHAGHFVPVRSGQASAPTTWDGTLDRYADEHGNLSVWDYVDGAVRRLDERRDGDVLGVDVSAWDVKTILVAAPQRVLLTFRDTETTVQYGYYGERSELRSLRILPVSFGMLLVLAAVGAIAITRREGWRALLPYAPFVLGAIATSVMSFPSSRYRLAMVLPLMTLGAVGVMAVARDADRRRRLASGLALALACGFFAVRTMTYELAHPGLWQIRIAQSEQARGDVDAVERRLQRAIELEPNDRHVRAAVARMRAMRGASP
jgi:hypothetical protein